MGRYRDQANFPITITIVLMIALDCSQTSIFSLCPTVGLERYPVVAGDGAEVVLQLLEQLLVALSLRHRCERVDVSEVAEAARHHFRCAVELHGARPERDHGVDQ